MIPSIRSKARNRFSPGAGWRSTARDYATFLQMYLNAARKLGGVRILSRTTVEMILSEQVGRDLFGGGDKHYGLAFGVVTEKGAGEGGEGSAGTFDWGGYFNTQYFADPKEGLIGVLMKQTQGGDDILAGSSVSWWGRRWMIEGGGGTAHGGNRAWQGCGCGVNRFPMKMRLAVVVVLVCSSSGL